MTDECNLLASFDGTITMSTCFAPELHIARRVVEVSVVDPPHIDHQPIHFLIQVGLGQSSPDDWTVRRNATSSIRKPSARSRNISSRDGCTVGMSISAAIRIPPRARTDHAVCPGTSHLYLIL